jgi:uncharacterized protein YcgI (DUF1989 family)
LQNPQRLIVPPQSGRGFRLPKGRHARVIDPQGQQVADLWAVADLDREPDWLSVSHTRDVAERLFPQVGESFYSARGRPLLTLVEDNSPGPHDMLFPACNPALYDHFGLPGHPNCRDNCTSALHAAGVETAFVPDPVNLFQNSPPQPDGRLEVLASRNPPGGNVLLRAETDLLVVLTACAVDFHPTNGGTCTEIVVEIE